MNGAAVLGIAALGTFLLRAAFLAIVPPRTFPPLLDRALAAAGPAVMAALIATHLAHAAPVGAPGTVPRIMAVGMAVLVARRAQNVGVAMAAGMSVLWVAHAVAA